MVRPPDEPRRPVEGNPIRLDPRFRRGRADPYREAAGSRPPHRVVGRLRSHLSRIQTEPIIEVNRDNAISRRIFQNMHIRNRSSNIEHNSMVYRSDIEQPQRPHNLRRTRNKPRRLGVTNAEHQRSRPDALDAATRQREELRLLLESYSEPEGPSESTENWIQQPQKGNFVLSETQLQEPQPGTSCASEYLNEEPQPGTSGASDNVNEEPQTSSSSSTWRGGSSDTISMSRRQGYWRPDLDINSSSSEEEIIENHTNKFARRNPRQLHSERDIVQDMKTYMRAQAEMRRTEARIRNLSESSSDSNSDLDINPGHQVENITMTYSRVKTSRNSKRRYSKRNVVEEVKADMRAQADTRRKETRFKGKRNFSDIDNGIESAKNIKAVNHESRENTEVKTRFTEKNIKVDHDHSEVNIEIDHCEAADVIETEPIETEENIKVDDGCTGINNDVVYHKSDFNTDFNSTESKEKNELADLKEDDNIEAHHPKTESITDAGIQKSDENNKFDSDKAESNIAVDNHIAQKNIEDGHHKTKDNFENSQHKAEKNMEDHKLERDIADSYRKIDDNIEGCQHKTDENIEFVYHNIKENVEAHHFKTERNIVNCLQKPDKNNEDVHPKTKIKFVGGHQKSDENVIADQRISGENNRNGHIESDGKIEAFLHDTAVNSKANVKNISNPIFNSKCAFDKRMGPNEKMYTESITTGNSHLKLEHGRVINENISRSSLTSMLNITKKSTFTCNTLRNAFSDQFEEKWNKPPYEDKEDKERQESLKKLRNILFELLFESQMSSPKGSTPVEQWWNKGRVEVFAKPIMKSNLKIDQSNVSKENETKVQSTHENNLENVNDICQYDKNDKTYQKNNDAGQESKEGDNA